MHEVSQEQIELKSLIQSQGKIDFNIKRNVEVTPQLLSQTYQVKANKQE